MKVGESKRWMRAVSMILKPDAGKCRGKLFDCTGTPNEVGIVFS